MSSQRVRDVLEEMEIDMLRAGNAQLQADKSRLLQKNNHLSAVFNLIQGTLLNYRKETPQQQLKRIEELINTIASE